VERRGDGEQIGEVRWAGLGIAHICWRAYLNLRDWVQVVGILLITRNLGNDSE